MFIPKHFKMKNENVIFEIMEHFSFAVLFSQYGGVPWATHLPLVLDRERKMLTGHFARANPQWKEAGGQEVLVVFQGPHSYISPSWYETGTAVPTWNYIAVHVYGQLKITREEDPVFESLKELVHKYEREDSKYDLMEVDADHVDALSKGIVGFTIDIDRIEAKAKLSQNHPPERQQRVASHLEKGTEQERQIAALMKKNLERTTDNE